jgi:MFS family permease
MPAVEREREPTFEESMDALEEGDAPIQVGAARAALASHDFRVVWFGAFASNIGTWMQNVTLGAFAWELTHSPTFVSLTAFAQLGPILVLSLVGGVLADTFDRRRLIAGAQTWQLFGSVALALIAAQHHPHETAILACVFAIGVGNAINGPAWASLLPSLVERRNLAGAISLNSTQMNASRVVGPAIAAPLYPAIGAAAVFAINAATYVFAVATVLAIHPARIEPVKAAPRGLRRLVEGFSIARRNPVLVRVLVTIALFSFLCLPFIGQMPTIAARNLHIRPKSFRYGFLYACFGLGAVTGALSIGTFLSRQDLRRVVQAGLAAFSLLLLTFSLLSSVGPAYPIAAMLGFAYLATVTSLSTVLQEEVDDAQRGRVVSLWQMGFGGVVPIGLLVAGPIAEATSIRFVLVYGAVAAAGLVWYARVSPLRPFEQRDGEPLEPGDTAPLDEHGVTLLEGPERVEGAADLMHLLAAVEGFVDGDEADAE